MNKHFLTAILAATFAAAIVAQDRAPARPPTGNPPNNPTAGQPSPADASHPNQTADLQVFDLDFDGGSPRDLVAALNNPLRGSLNVIIPNELQDIMIPSLKLKQVNVAQVFEALQRASSKTTYYEVGAGARKTLQASSESYQFSTSGPVTDHSVWSFFAPGHTRIPSRADVPICNYYQLAPVLEDLKIEDITTAIQTGWKMLNIAEPPTLKFHPETKLLIAVGKADELALIDDVLARLSQGSPRAKRLKEVLINGEVNRPGNIELPADKKMTILDAIGRAGGLTQKANPGRIRFNHAGESERTFQFDDLKKESDPGKTIYLEPGDVIDVAAKLL